MAQTDVSQYLCIGCPLGCRLEVEANGPDIVEVRGFSCRIGKEFAIQEHTAPTRMLATTVSVHNGQWARLPVKTEAAVPKEKVLPLADALHQLELHAPIRTGDVVLKDALGTGVNVIATRDLPVLQA